MQCAVPFYGGGIAGRLGTPTCPTLLLFGGRDDYIPTEDIEAVRAHHPDETVVYPDAGHGFFRDGSDSYDESAAADAWHRLTGHAPRAPRLSRPRCVSERRMRCGMRRSDTHR